MKNKIEFVDYRGIVVKTEQFYASDEFNTYSKSRAMFQESLDIAVRAYVYEVRGVEDEFLYSFDEDDFMTLEQELDEEQERE